MKKTLFGVLFIFIMAVLLVNGQSAKKSQQATSVTVSSKKELKSNGNDTFINVSYTPSSDGKSVKVGFSAGKNTRIYLVSLLSGDKSIDVGRISNTSGEMHSENGATMLAGSSLLMGRFVFLIDKGTVIECEFTKETTFIPQKIKFVLEEGGESFTYNISSKNWE